MILVIDNYDSFTYNLVHLVEMQGAEVCVRRNDEISVEEIKCSDFKRVIISPGPCTPKECNLELMYSVVKL